MSNKSLNKSILHYDVAIIGGGIIGTAILHELSRYNVKTILLEKHHDVAEGITKANSGVLHAGFNVPTSSRKAKFNVEGLNLFKALARDLGVPVKNCKKLVIAKNESELPYIKKLFEQGIKNGVSGISLINRDQIRNLQPNVEGKFALFSEETSVTLPYMMAIALAENAVLNGVEVKLNNEVIGINETQPGIYRLNTANGEIIEAKLVINASGINADKVMGFLEVPTERVYPWRGEYHLLEEDSTEVVSMAVYPVPPKDGSGLGVHITPTVNGGILLGPSAEFINSRDDTGNTTGVLELLRKEAFVLVPALKGFQTIKNYSGIRPKLFEPESEVNFKDFFIQESEHYQGVLHLIGIESPGLTAAPAIAKYIIDKFIARYIQLHLKKDWHIRREPIPRLRELSVREKQGLWVDDNEYGHILCHCEQVSRAEVARAINNPLGAVSINAIRKRTHATLGRCQSSFCLGPITAEIMDKGYNLSAVGRGTPVHPVYEGLESE